MRSPTSAAVVLMAWRRRQFACAVVMLVIIGAGSVLRPLACFRAGGCDPLCGTWNSDCFLFFNNVPESFSYSFPELAVV